MRTTAIARRVMRGCFVLVLLGLSLYGSQVEVHAQNDPKQAPPPAQPGQPVPVQPGQPVPGQPVGTPTDPNNPGTIPGQPGQPGGIPTDPNNPGAIPGGIPGDPNSLGGMSTPKPKPPAWWKKPVDVPISLLFTSDLYGRLRRFACKRPGVQGYRRPEVKSDISNLLAQVKKARSDAIRAQKPTPLLFNTGDNLATDLTARFLLEFEGLAGVDFISSVFKRFAYDLIGLGNHEFSVSKKKLTAFLYQSHIRGLQFSLANLERVPASHPLKRYVNYDQSKSQPVPYFVFTRDFLPNPKQPMNKVSIKIGVFHLVPGGLEKKVTAANVVGVKFGDPTEKARELVQKLRSVEKVDLVVMLSHLEGRSSKGKKALEVVKGIADGSANSHIDLVLTNELRDGGKATSFSVHQRNGKSTFIVGSAKYGSMLGRVDVTVRKEFKQAGSIVALSPSQIPLKKKLYDLPLRRELVKWEITYCKSWARKLGKGTIRDPGMSREQFTTYMLNLMRELSKAEIAYINKGAIRRGPFPLKGYVTKDDLYRSLPFNEKIEVLTVKGSQLQEMLQNKSVGELAYVGWDGSQVNGRELEQEKYYSVATISFLVAPQIKALRRGLKNAQRAYKEAVNKPSLLRNEILWLRKGKRGKPLKRGQPGPIETEGIEQISAKVKKGRAAVAKAKKEFASLKAKIKTLRAQNKKMEADNLAFQVSEKEGAISQAKEDLKYKTDELKQKQNELKQKTSTLKKDLEQAKKDFSRTRNDLRTAKEKLSLFLQRRRVLLYKGCDDAKNPRCTPRLRDVMISHFVANRYKQYVKRTPPPSNDGGFGGGGFGGGGFGGGGFGGGGFGGGGGSAKKKKVEPFGMGEIPFTGKFVDLSNRLAWKFDSNVEIRFNSTFANPINLANLSYGNAPTEFFRQIQGSALINLKFQMMTRAHQWNNEFRLEYGVYTRDQWNTTTNLGSQQILDEQPDNLNFSSEYKFNSFQRYKPFVRGELITELTRRGRPNLSDEEFVKVMQQIRFRTFQLKGNLGLDWSVIPQALSLKPAFTYQKEFAIQRYPIVGSEAAKRFPNLSGLPDTNHQIGIALAYELMELTLFKVGRVPITFSSRGNYSLRLVIAPDLPEQDTLLFHEFNTENALSVRFSQRVSFRLGFKFTLFRGTLPKNADGGGGGGLGGGTGPELRIQGPWAYWFSPTAGLEFRWGARGQAY